MTIEEYAAAQNLPEIKEYRINFRGQDTRVYLLENGETGAIGLPFFAVEIKNGYRQATADETIIIMNKIYTNER